VALDEVTARAISVAVPAVSLIVGVNSTRYSPGKTLVAAPLSAIAVPLLVASIRLVSMTGRRRSAVVSDHVTEPEVVVVGVEKSATVFTDAVAGRMGN